MIGDKTELQYIRAIRDLIKDPARWCTRHHAEDKEGHQVTSESDKACRWCVEGAAYKIGISTYYDVWQKINDKARKLYDMAPWMVNDRVGHHGVMRLLNAVEKDLLNDNQA